MSNRDQSYLAQKQPEKDKIYKILVCKTLCNRQQKTVPLRDGKQSELNRKGV